MFIPSETLFDKALKLARSGESFQDVMREALRQKLIEYKNEGVKSVSIMPAPDCCPACKDMNTERVKVEDELKNQRLPCMTCTSPLYRKKSVTGWCRCDYLPH